MAYFMAYIGICNTDDFDCCKIVKTTDIIILYSINFFRLTVIKIISTANSAYTTETVLWVLVTRSAHLGTLLLIEVTTWYRVHLKAMINYRFSCRDQIYNAGSIVRGVDNKKICQKCFGF